MTRLRGVRWISWCLGWTLILVGAASSARADNQGAAAAFRSEDVTAILAQLREYERREFQRTLTYKVSTVVMPRAGAEPVAESFVVSCGKDGHLVESRDPRSGAKSVFASSEYGQFRVDETGKGQGTGTKLSHYVKPENPDKALESVKQGFGVKLPLILPLTGMPRETWFDFFSKLTGLKFTLSREEPNGNIQLAFDSEQFSGSLTLLSASNPVVLRSVRSRKGQPWTTTTERVLLPTEPADAMPRCAKLEVVMHNKDTSKEMMRGTFDFRDYVVETPPEKAFHLSNYGLPDPEGVPAPSRRHLWIWLVSIAASLFLIAGLLRWVARRRTPPA